MSMIFWPRSGWPMNKRDKNTMSSMSRPDDYHGRGDSRPAVKVCGLVPGQTKYNSPVATAAGKSDVPVVHFDCSKIKSLGWSAAARLKR